MKSAKAVVLCGKASYRFRACVVIFLTHLLCLTTQSYAQVGDYRTDLAVGVNGGVSMSNVAFVPTVPQTWLNGPTFGLSARYTCEKYFNSICALVAEHSTTPGRSTICRYRCWRASDGVGRETVCSSLFSWDLKWVSI